MGDSKQPRVKVSQAHAVLIVLASVALAGVFSSADVEESLRWAEKPVSTEPVKTNPAESPWPNPQATSIPVQPPAPPRTPEQSIPPEIMALYDADILEGLRPTYSTIKRDDIFKLRDFPRLPGDFVRLDVDLTKLSLVQTEILRQWAYGGHNRIMLMGQEVGQYADFLDGRRAFFRSDNDRRPRVLVLKHQYALANDCANVSVPWDWRESLLSRCYQWEGVTACLTPQVEIFAYYRDEKNMRPLPENARCRCQPQDGKCQTCPAECCECCDDDDDDDDDDHHGKRCDSQPHERKKCKDERVIAYGRFKAGATEVCFRPYYRATDSDGYRFELNWTHWILGRRIPAPAVTSVPAAEPPAVGPPAPAK